MSVAVSKSRKGSSGSSSGGAPWITAQKVRELSGLLLMTLALFLLLSLVSYRPGDPSLLHRAAGAAETENWIGPTGAQIAALAYAFLGLTALLVPLLVGVLGWRRLRGREGDMALARGVGAVVLLASLPALFQLTVGSFRWGGELFQAGGAFGELLAGALEGQLHFVGSLLILFAAAAVGGTLLVQTTLGEVLRLWGLRLAAWGQRFALAWARWRERRAKERSHRKVVAKHVERVVAEKRAGVEGGASPPLDLPLRVVEKRGEGEFSVRRVRASEVTADPPPAFPVTPRPAPAGGAKVPANPARPQGQLPLVPLPTSPNQLPPLNLLQMESGKGEIDENELVRMGELIRGRCAEFGVQGTVEGIQPGPVITVFEFQPAPGVKVSQIVNLQDDLALALKAESVRIDRLPGRSTLGIEVPNKKRAIIHLGPLLGREGFKKSGSPLTMALGTTISGEPCFADLATMPHLLVAGATGSGKSVGLQSMITSILYRATREEVQFIFIDPKRIELGVYADIPHLKAEVVVDPEKAANALRWAVGEMERRYRLLAEVHVRSIAYYNRAIRDPEVRRRLALADTDGEGESAAELKPLPYYVIVIDELADLMMVASAEVETAIARLAQMARAVGIHLIVATQRPSVDVLTGTIKANFPCRISFATATRHDSRTILDQVGSEKLLGKGDMLFMPPGTSRIQRLHGAYVSEQETAALVRWLKKLGKPDLDPEVLKGDERSSAGGGVDDEEDELYDEAARLVVAEGQASASFLQRRMRVGFSRAARLIDMMERDGLLGPPQGSKPRDVLVKPDYFEEIDRAREGM